ncbi:MAG: hypothetical protein ACK5NG_05350 [Chthoniobacterales bacterium]
MPSRADAFILFRVWFVFFASLSLGACFSLKDNRAATQAWLNQQNVSSRINIAGTWKSDLWGRANFQQTGNKITGQMGIYDVKGRVSGEKIYLAFSDAGRTYYTSILSRESSRKLSGRISPSLPFSDSNARGFILKKF